MRRLITDRIRPRLGVEPSCSQDDAAVLPPIDGQPVVTTDAFVVSPLFFPGGDIGSLAIYGTVNDLAVRGAQPLWLTVSLVLEEGLPFSVLDRVLESMGQAAARCEVRVVAGDTKVVPRGSADGIFITTTGLGRLVDPAPTGSATIEIGDVLLVSGPIGRHGTAILVAREQMPFDPPPTSDCGPLLDATAALRAAGIRVRALRDATRGGVTAVLHEWARDCGHTLVVDEAWVPVNGEVRGVCELLGFDALAVANEGTLVAAVAASDSDAALEALRSVAGGEAAAVIGEVRAMRSFSVLKRTIGREQPLVEPSGAPFPRIC
jgi:hydrogenase expression/formation protein HypE